MEIISSVNYSETMQKKVEPYLEKYRVIKYFERTKGEPICYERYAMPDAKACVIISHGFTENSDKYHEQAYYFLNEGYSVYIINHRGHGRSFRMTKDPSLVHIKDFNGLTEDFAFFAAKIVKEENSGLPCFVYAHSMGGGIAGTVMEDEPKLFDKAVLTSPMMSINLGKIPKWAAAAFVKTKISTGHGEDYIRGQQAFDGTRDFEHSMTSGRERYDYYFDRCLENEYMRTWGSSYVNSLEMSKLADHVSEVSRCRKVVTPTLLFSAGEDGAVTDIGQKIFADNAASVEFIIVPGVRHEIFTAADEIIGPYWDKIMKFFRE